MCKQLDSGSVTDITQCKFKFGSLMTVFRLCFEKAFFLFHAHLSRQKFTQPSSTPHPQSPCFWGCHDEYDTAHCPAFSL